MIKAVGKHPVANSSHTSTDAILLQLKTTHDALKIFLMMDKNTQYLLNELRVHHMPTQPFFQRQKVKFRDIVTREYVQFLSSEAPKTAFASSSNSSSSFRTSTIVITLLSSSIHSSLGVEVTVDVELSAIFHVFDTCTNTRGGKCWRSTYSTQWRGWISSRPWRIRTTAVF
jgi:hypothetical protein